MKLKNKKTGAVREFSYVGAWNGRIVDDYDTLAELNEEWEDYEESKEYWFIDDTSSTGINNGIDKSRKMENFDKEIGNYFETKEEAEKAVEKLKAWKRLKDAGFEFKGWKVLDHDSPRIYFNVYRKNSDDIIPFLDLLFGGEE